MSTYYVTSEYFNVEGKPNDEILVGVFSKDNDENAKTKLIQDYELDSRYRNKNLRLYRAEDGDRKILIEQIIKHAKQKKRISRKK